MTSVLLDRLVGRIGIGGEDARVELRPVRGLAGIADETAEDVHGVAKLAPRFAGAARARLGGWEQAGHGWSPVLLAKGRARPLRRTVCAGLRGRAVS